MHNQDLAQTYLSLKPSSKIPSSSQNENKNLIEYRSNPNDKNYLKGYRHLSVPNQVIQNILGYPVTEAIMDEEGNVILDIGDLITHQAVERAIKANVFNILLDAVYIRK